MLKKVLTMGAFCMMSCGVSFAKGGALDLANTSLKGLPSMGFTYKCSGDEKQAICSIKDSTHRYVRFNNINLTFTLNDFDLTQKIMADIETPFLQNYRQFFPKHIECERNVNLDKTNLNLNDSGMCAIVADVATMKISTDTLLQSKEFYYKTMFSALKLMLDKTEYYITKINRINSEYDQKMKDLMAQKNEVVGKLYAQKAFSKNQLEKAEDNECDVSRAREDLESINVALRKVSEKYDEQERNLMQERKDARDDVKDEIVAWLKNYNLNVKEMRLFIHANNLADEVFALSGGFTIQPNKNMVLSRADKKEIAKLQEKQKKVYAQYYASLEAMRAGAITYIAQSQYLNPELKKSLGRVVSESVKLVDPNAHKKFLRILIRHLNDTPINLGDEAEKFAELVEYGDKKSAIKAIFDIINQYEIKAVRYWPQS